MRTFILSLICLTVVTAAECVAGEVIFDQSRITFDSRKAQRNSTDEVLKTYVFFGGMGSEGDTTRDLGKHIIGHLNKLTSTDTVLYAFGTSSPEDSALVESLVTIHPREWRKITRQKKDKLSRFFDRESFLEVPVNKNGRFHILIDENSNPEMNKWVTILDAEGKILARCHGWEG